MHQSGSWYTLINYNLKIKINGKKLLQSSTVKYLGIVLDPFLNWSAHVNSLAPKLNRAAGMLAKIRHFVTAHTLRNIYFGIFSLLLTYGSQVWGQFFNQHISRLQKIQNKAIRIMSFANFQEESTPLYNKCGILKLSDHIKLENFIYVHNSIRNNLPMPLRGSFQLTENLHDNCTRGATMHKMVLPKVRTIYGLNSIKYKSTATWNYMVSVLPKVHSASKEMCKKNITEYFITNYT